MNLTRETYRNGSDTTVLNTVDIWIPSSDSDVHDQAKIWLIYIHGGAWRDPEVDSKSFEAAVDSLKESSSKDRFAGFASINYRLSPYPSHPRLPSSPDDPARNVHNPCHVQDVAEALLYLDAKYKIQNRYLLAGHSAGGTMAFHLGSSYTSGRPLPQPLAVLGIAGIYDLDTLVKSHSDISAYDELTVNAFPDRESWAAVSPSSTSHPRGALWEKAKAVIVSSSKDDELVEADQAKYMLDRARKLLSGKENVYFLETSGTHDEIWGNGDNLASLISRALTVVDYQK